MTGNVAPGPHGPLASVIAVRGGTAAGHGLEHREALIYALGKAAELEHLVMLQYQFAAYSLKHRADEGLSPEQLAAVQRWRKTLLAISEQEMLHLAIVQNLLTAVGAAPRLARPNFPMPAYAYPAGVRIELVPFGEAALRHFAYLERPEGMAVDDAEGFEAIARGRRPAARSRGRDRPAAPGVRDHRPALPVNRGRLRAPRRAAGPRAPVRRAAERPGHRGALPLAGAGGRHGRRVRTARPSTPSSSRARAPAARGARPTSGASLAILDEYLEIRAADPAFDPARPVVAANVRRQSTGIVVPLITDPGTARCMDLLNVANEVVLQLLSRYFAHTDETRRAAGRARRCRRRPHVHGDQAAGRRS